MPAGMMLKSDGFASNLSAPGTEGTLAAYCARNGHAYHDTRLPVSLDLFVEYALDFQQRFVPDVEDRYVSVVERTGKSFTLTLDDGEILTADLVVVATGITHLERVPAELADLPPELATHSSAHNDLEQFANRDVTVVGAGSSAIDLATLLHEAGATTHLVARSDRLRFSSPPGPDPRSRWQRLRHPSSGLGPGLRSWLFQNVPSLYRFLPGAAAAEARAAPPRPTGRVADAGAIRGRRRRHARGTDRARERRGRSGAAASPHARTEHTETSRRITLLRRQATGRTSTVSISSASLCEDHCAPTPICRSYLGASRALSPGSTWSGRRR